LRQIETAIDIAAPPLAVWNVLVDFAAYPDWNPFIRRLHGEATVGNDGVVTVTVLRTDRILLDGVRVAPQCGISTTIQFKPSRKDDDARGGNRANAQVCPDFSMTAAEVVPVIKRMQLDHHWFQGSLRNDETNQQPQLFWDAMVKEGDAYQLAQEVRSGLDLTHSK